MDFGSIGGMGGAAASFLATPQGQEQVKAFLSSPDGMTLLKNFASTPDGQKVIISVLPSVLGALNLPPAVTEMIKGAIASHQ